MGILWGHLAAVRVAHEAFGLDLPREVDEVAVPVVRVLQQEAVAAVGGHVGRQRVEHAHRAVCEGDQGRSAEVGVVSGDQERSEEIRACSPSKQSARWRRRSRCSGRWTAIRLHILDASSEQRT